MENENEKLPNVTDYQAWPGWQVQQVEDIRKKDPITPLADYYAAQGHFEEAVKFGEEAISQLEAKLNKAKSYKAVNARSTDAYCPWFVTCYELAKNIATYKTAIYCSKINSEKAAEIINNAAGSKIISTDDFRADGVGTKLGLLVEKNKKQLYEYNLTNWMLSLALFKTEW